MQKNEHTESQFRRRDMAEVAVGACIMAFPVAATEEIWNLGTDLELWRALLFALASVCFLAALIYVLHGHDQFPANRKTFLLRVVGTYGITLAISASLLLGVDQLDFLQDPAIALKRIILVAFPASFAATTVDSFADRSNGSQISQSKQVDTASTSRSPNVAAGDVSDLALSDEKDLSGEIVSAEISIHHNTFDNVQFGLKYSYFDVRVEFENTDLINAIDYTYHGPMLSLGIVF